MAAASVLNVYVVRPYFDQTSSERPTRLLLYWDKQQQPRCWIAYAFATATEENKRHRGFPPHDKQNNHFIGLLFPSLHSFVVSDFTIIPAHSSSTCSNQEVIDLDEEDDK
jgi:hypothetical protein